MSSLNDIANYSDDISGAEIFNQKYHAYAASLYWKNSNKNKLESSDKIVLPPSALQKLNASNIFSSLKHNNPLIFEIGNNSDILPKKTHCSVIEFTANEGCCYLPIQMMDNLGLGYHGYDIIQLKNVKLPKGKFIQIQAHKTLQILNLSTLNISKQILEKKLNKYSSLTVGDTIQIEYNLNIYKFDIILVKPSIIKSTAPPAISIVECDIEIDFKQPRDYKQWKTLQQNDDNILESLSISSPNSFDDSKDNINDDSLSSSEYSNDDPVASPDYFDSIYGLNQRQLTPDHNTSNEANDKESVFSFGDANKGFSFCDDGDQGKADKDKIEENNKEKH